MKIKIELEKGENLQDADDQLEKIVKAKKVVHSKEKYSDDHYNAFEKLIELKHKRLVEKIVAELRESIENDLKKM